MRRARKFAILLSHRRWVRGLWHGVAAAVEHRRLPISRRTATVVDVGAHKGQFALYARELLPSAEVHCFEPLDEPRTILGRLFAEDSSVHVYPFALGASEGVADIFVSQRNDSSSLLRITEKQVSRFPGTELASVRSTTVQQLDVALRDALLKKPVLLKIDVQGSELDVLKGGTNVLRACSQVLVECSFVELYDRQPLFDVIYTHLAERGFVLSAANCSARDAMGAWLQADILFQSTQMLGK